MKKFGKGHVESYASEKVSPAKAALEQKSSGSMDYMSVQDGFANGDASKLRKNEFRFDRYK